MHKERPVLSGLIKEGTRDLEQFQNHVVRPIIKMQHTLLIAFLKNHLEKRKVDFSVLPDKKKRSKVSSFFKTDNNFKNIILGFIVGHFSVEEFDFYLENSSEINRRILQITLQRIKDSIGELQ
ncbi:glyoxalase [Polaribacter sp. MSW13]|uniref:Glyoxalase n=1 Tax=Polaribacter marinus TaxID=2916838 RepID=A0A9X1VNV7_9FLAO|nr:glyoxalase [Polaribacter marinus]MCI2229637.1 glyoxalase [Polaribacter marinus]